MAERQPPEGCAGHDLLMQKIAYIERDISQICKKLDEKYVLYSRFAPIEKVVYGGVGVILVGVVTGILGLILGAGK